MIFFSQKITAMFKQHICFLLPGITLFLFAMCVISMIVPKKVIDTYQTNITEEEGDKEYSIPLESRDIVTYHMNTGNRPIMGIHVGLVKNGNSYQEEKLFCRVYTEQEATPVSENEYQLSQGEDIQFIYLPFENYELCRGNIRIEFSYAGEKPAPGLLANGKVIKDTETAVNGNEIAGSLKTMYVYTHDTYPLVYDLRILTVLFLAASMALPFKQSKAG